MMISPKSAAAAGDGFGKQPVCAGPYKFVERVAQDRIVVERFQDYWDKEDIFISRVVFRPIADSSVRLANLRSGDLDIIERVAPIHYVDIGKYPQLRGSAISGFADFYFYIMFNLNNGPRARTPLGQDSRVREAFELAIDRDVINEIVFAGQYIPTNQWLPPQDPFYAKTLPIPKRDVVKARELLAAAGVRHPTIELMVNNVPETRQIGELLQAMTGEAGFDLRVRPTETASAYQASRTGDFEAFLTAFLGRGDPDTFIYPTLACGGPYNDGRYCNPEVENLLSDARTRFASGERKSLYASAASIILRERPNVYLMVRPFLFGYSTKLSGFRPIPGGLIHLQGVKLN
jgi:peptide/nickel transport system substrate-binding protein